MNTQLVDYLVGVITRLNPEEQTLLQEKLAIEKVSQDQGVMLSYIKRL